MCARIEETKYAKDIASLKAKSKGSIDYSRWIGEITSGKTEELEEENTREEALKRNTAVENCEGKGDGEN
jgi:hypothetical protein